VILDASVAAKWVLADPSELLREPADALLRQLLAGEIEIAVPDLFWPEMVNLLARAVRRGRTPPEAAPLALAQLRQAGLITHPTLPLADEALPLAIHWQMPAYDLFYVLLALDLDDTLITADERLLRTLGPRFPVRWLGASC